MAERIMIDEQISSPISLSDHSAFVYDDDDDSRCLMRWNWFYESDVLLYDVMREMYLGGLEWNAWHWRMGEKAVLL